MSDLNDLKNRVEALHNKLRDAITTASDSQARLNHARQRQQETESQLTAARQGLTNAELHHKNMIRQFMVGTADQGDVDTSTRASADLRTRVENIAAMAESFPAAIREIEAAHAKAVNAVAGLRMHYWQIRRDLQKASAPRQLREHLETLLALGELAGQPPINTSSICDPITIDAIAAVKAELVNGAGLLR